MTTKNQVKTEIHKGKDSFKIMEVFRHGTNSRYTDILYATPKDMFSFGDIYKLVFDSHTEKMWQYVWVNDTQSWKELDCGDAWVRKTISRHQKAYQFKTGMALPEDIKKIDTFVFVDTLAKSMIVSNHTTRVKA